MLGICTVFNGIIWLPVLFSVILDCSLCSISISFLHVQVICFILVAEVGYLAYSPLPGHGTSEYLLCRCARKALTYGYKGRVWFMCMFPIRTIGLMGKEGGWTCTEGRV